MRLDYSAPCFTSCIIVCTYTLNSKRIVHIFHMEHKQLMIYGSAGRRQRGLVQIIKVRVLQGRFS